MNRIYDISVGLKPDMPVWPGDRPFEIAASKSIAKGDGANLSVLTMGAHVGTHMDAPLHYISGGAAISSLPLDAVIGPARVIQIEGPKIDCAAIESAEIRNSDRVLFKTDNSAGLWEKKEFDEKYVHIVPEAAHFLADSEIQVVGIDYLSVGGVSGGEIVHRILLEAGIWLIEGINLKNVPPGEYNLICLPLSIPGAEGAPARAVLISSS